MKALRLIEGASYGPDELKILTTVFDDLWEQLAPEVRARAEAAGAARLKLANAVLAVAKQGPVELERVKNDTLRLIFAGPSAGVQARRLTVVPSKRT